MKIENMTINGVTIGAINIMGGAGTVSTDLGDEGIKNLESVLKGALAGKTAECLSLGKQEGLVLGKEEGLVLGKEEAPGLSLGTPMPKGDDAAPGDDEDADDKDDDEDWDFDDEDEDNGDDDEDADEAEDEDEDDDDDEDADEAEDAPPPPDACGSISLGSAPDLDEANRQADLAYQEDASSGITTGPSLGLGTAGGSPDDEGHGPAGDRSGEYAPGAARLFDDPASWDEDEGDGPPRVSLG